MRFRTLLVDVYGTLVDQMAVEGDLASFYSLPRRFAGMVARGWHQQRARYVNRNRALEEYSPFWHLTIYGLRDALAWHGLPDSSEPRQAALEAYGQLPLHLDVETHFPEFAREFERTMYVTNANPEMIEVLKGHGTLPGVDDLISAQDVESYLPGPEAFDEILSRIEAAPDECLYLSIRIGHLQAARQGGMNTLWLNRENEPLPCAVDEPDGVLDSFPHPSFLETETGRGPCDDQKTNPDR